MTINKIKDRKSAGINGMPGEDGNTEERS